VVRAAAMDEGELYPCQLGIFCDRCGETFEGDFIVSVNMTRDERLGVIRKHMTTVHGWRCDEHGDICYRCLTRPQNVITGTVTGIVTGIVIQGHDFHGGLHL
jgi:hypothetical protein